MRNLPTTFIGLILALSTASPALAQILQFDVVLAGQFEVPPVVTQGNGSGTAIYDTQSKLLTLNLSYQDLSGPALGVHIHGPALINQNAGLVWVLTTGSPVVDVLGPLTNDEEQILLSGRYYINAHTAEFPAGEIRGQLQNPSVTAVDDGSIQQLPTRLGQNHPNPFNPSTTISFGIRESAHVTLRIFDASGRIVTTLIDESRQAGRYSEMWDGRDEKGRAVPSGIYFYKLEADEYLETKKMVLVR